jgi:hypothetical protein
MNKPTPTGDAELLKNRADWDNAANTPWLDNPLTEFDQADTPPPTRSQKTIVALAVALALLCVGTAFLPELLARWPR